MNKEKNWDGLTGLVAVIFGLLYIYSIYTTPRANFGDPLDPLYFPYGIAFLFIFLGIILMIKGRVQPSIEAIKSIINEDGVKKRDRRRVLYTCLISIAYALVFEHLGYVLSTTIFMLAVLFLTNGVKKWKTNLSIALVFSLVIYILFSKLLGISLPPLPFDVGGDTW